MRRFLRRRSRPAAWALIAALVVAFVVNCAPTAEATPAQKACCVAMGHDCGPTGQEQDCCATESARLDSFAAASSVGALAPVSLGAALILPATASPSSQARRVDRDRAHLNFPGVPTYLRSSVLLL